MYNKSIDVDATACEQMFLTHVCGEETVLDAWLDVYREIVQFITKLFNSRGS